jgi:hypothetical protein
MVYMYSDPLVDKIVKEEQIDEKTKKISISYT